MFERLSKLEKRYKELESLLSDPKTLQDKNLYAKHAKEFAALGVITNKHKEYVSVVQELKKIAEMLKSKDHQNDKDFLELANQELSEMEAKKADLEHQLENLLIEDDGTTHKNVIVEIRAGTGGEEAALFTADLYRMYAKYAAKSGWKIEVMGSRPTSIGGFKEVIFSIQGVNAFKKLKYESGVHRVQRVPATEASGRIHTSAVSVAVLPEPEEVEVNIDPKDLKVDVYRSTGPGGQGVNTTDSAVRITHMPSGIVVSCQDERSQIKNKAKAMRVLRARILDKIQSEQQNKISQQRKSQVGTGDRSEKIRTYNFPDRRVTDHRIGLTLHKLELILDGGLEEISAALLEEEKKIKLKQWKKE
ncbi:MAG: peptide chain release factor 1 [Candidatus Omnitrophica bacterium]|nr:peptide chain release factor 1 [Candidatus Omnitrophota bacterium]